MPSKPKKTTPRSSWQNLPVAYPQAFPPHEKSIQLQQVSSQQQEFIQSQQVKVNEFSAFKNSWSMLTVSRITSNKSSNFSRPNCWKFHASEVFRGLICWVKCGEIPQVLLKKTSWKHKCLCVSHRQSTDKKKGGNLKTWTFIGVLHTTGLLEVLGVVVSQVLLLSGLKLEEFK